MKRKVTFYIDDASYMRYHLRKYEKLSEEQIANILCGYDEFRIKFTLFGNNFHFEYYEIVGEDGIFYADWQFNDYQREFFTECMGYYVGQIEEPFGVIRIAESYY